MKTQMFLLRTLKDTTDYKMKKLISTIMLMTSLTGQAALIETVQGNPGNAIETLKCIPRGFIVSDPTVAAPCRNPLSSTTTTPTILIESEFDLYSGSTSVNLINETLGESSELTTIVDVAIYLGLSIEEVQSAVLYLYDNSEVSVENIENFYDL